MSPQNSVENIHLRYVAPAFNCSSSPTREDIICKIIKKKMYMKGNIVKVFHVGLHETPLQYHVIAKCRPKGYVHVIQSIEVNWSIGIVQPA